MSRAFFIVLLTLLSSALARHFYYALDKDSRYVSDSPSLAEITHCKDQCLKMKDVYKGIRFRVNALLRSSIE